MPDGSWSVQARDRHRVAWTEWPEQRRQADERCTCHVRRIREAASRQWSRLQGSWRLQGSSGTRRLDRTFARQQGRFEGRGSKEAGGREECSHAQPPVTGSGLRHQVLESREGARDAHSPRESRVDSRLATRLDARTPTCLARLMPLERLRRSFLAVCRVGPFLLSSSASPFLLSRSGSSRGRRTSASLSSCWRCKSSVSSCSCTSSS